MNHKVILPPKIVPYTGPPVFLAGPIQGAPDWQSQAIQIFEEVLPKSSPISCTIASPRCLDLTTEFNYTKQVDWESHYLLEAATHGVILFWLAKEANHTCDRAYAQTTRFELGEWVAKRSAWNIVVGIEEGFTGAKYIRHRLSELSMPVTDTLKKTCDAAIYKLWANPIISWVD